jgi:cytochrome c oxidase assembly factor CtaG
MITRVALALLTIVLLPLLAIALPVVFVMAWIEEARRERALRIGPQRQARVGGL